MVAPPRFPEAQGYGIMIILTVELRFPFRYYMSTVEAELQVQRNVRQW
jgi:hypothetical protein